MKQNNKIEKTNLQIGESFRQENFGKLYSSSITNEFGNAECYINSKFLIRPEYVEREVGNKGIITWGVDNLYPQQLIDICYNVPEQQAIVTKISSLVAGQGLYIPTNISSGLKKFLSNEAGESNINKIVKKISWDTCVFGGFALEVQWASNGIGAINHISLQNLRIALPKEDRPDGFMYSDNWSKVNKHKPIFIPAYDPKLDKKEYPNQIYFAKYNDMGIQNYCLPIYYGALNEILLAWEISNFHLSGIRNGIYGNVIFTFFEVPEQEQRREHYEKINEQYGGTSSANKCMVFYVSDPTLKPEITVLDPVKNDEKYLGISEQITQKILTGWGLVNPEIIGIPSPQGISSSSDDIIFATYRLQNEVINPLQSFIEENLTELAKQNGVYESITINKIYTDEKIANLMSDFGTKTSTIQTEDETQQDKNNTL